MASNINPNIIDGTYPIPGQDNDSQGFRDNFTNTRNNFQSAKNELEDLQAKCIVNAQLSVSGSSPANNLNNLPLQNARLRNMKETVVSHPTTSGTITVNYTEGHYHRIDGNTTGPITLQVNNWPAAGNHGWFRFELSVNNVAHTLTLPAGFTVGADKIRGFDAGVITFENTGTHIFEFYTRNQGNTVGIVDLVRREPAEVPVSAMMLWGSPTAPAGWTATGQQLEATDSSILYVIQKN